MTLLFLFVGSAVIGVAFYFGLEVIAADIEMQLRDHPQVQQHLGELQTFEVDFMKSTLNDDDDAFVYNATGSKGSAELTVVSRSNFDGREEIESANMRLSDGTIIAIEIGSQADRQICAEFSTQWIAG